jgi:amino acid adenylation domain-containing protein
MRTVAMRGSCRTPTGPESISRSRNRLSVTDVPPTLRPVDFDPFAQVADHEVRLPLTAPQAEMWTAAAMSDEASCSYNQCFVFELDGPLRVDSLSAALDQVVKRHAGLRVVIAPDGMSQTIRPPFSMELPVHDLSALDPTARATEIEVLVNRECETPFDLAEGPLIRAFVVREGGDRHRFVLTVHHIVCDGWSSSVLFTDLSLFYVADRIGIPAQLGSAASYRDYVLLQTSETHLADATVDEDQWAEQYLDGAPVLDLPSARRPPLKTYRSGREELRIDGELYVALRRTGARSGATLFTTLLAAYEVLLMRLSGQSDLVVGVPFAGQPQLENSALVAHCVSTAPLRARLEADSPFSSYVRSVGESLAWAQDHSLLTFGSLVRRLNIQRDPSRTPLVSTMFTVDKIGAPFDFGDVKILSVGSPKSYCNFELQLTLVDSGSDIVVECDYNSDLFDGPGLRRWLSHYETLLVGIADAPESPIGALPLLNETDRRTILEEWNDTGVAYPEEKRLHRLFEAQVGRTPDAQALVDRSERVLYHELNTRANRLAHYLRRSGIGPGATVGVCLERRADLVVALLAVLKAGGAYIPLDPAYPSDRLAFMLKDSRASIVVTQSDLGLSFDLSEVEQIVVDADASSIASESAENLDDGAANTDLAYVIYTSGSTGVPKGVAIEHRSAGTLVHWAGTVFSGEEITGVLASTSVCFDLSVFEIFFPLASGGSLILADNALEIASLPTRDEVTLVNTVPSAAAEIIRVDAMPASVRTVCLAGEPLPTRLVDAIYESTQVQRVFDLYGPSEDTTYSTFALREPGASATIGRPISNTRAYVLDAFGEPVPIGVVGELYLTGDGLARGYLYRDELTAERFVSGTFSGAVERAYRTGDHARYRPDGMLEFLGRTDHQVKIRGFRIELGEIEAALTRHEEVEDAVVVVREDRLDDRRLVAYVVPRSAPEGLADRLRSGLRDKLPSYMVPVHIVLLPALPRTPNGKVDRGSLPSPEMDASAAGTPHAEPRTPTESRIARVWADVLGTESPGVDDNFFDTGGDSLKAAQIVTAIRSDFGVDAGMRHLWEQPTIAGLAEIVDILAVSAPGVPVGGEREEIEL